MNERQPVTFPNAQGETLFGVLERPATPRRDLGVILLSPGIKSRVAPHRLYNKLARRLVGHGFTVLRFDFAGLGDSEGTVPEPLLADLYRAIQLGRYVGDTHAAIEWMRRETGVERIVLGGLCGGAITGLLAASHSPHVAGLFSIGLPVILDGTAVDKVATMSEGQRRSVRHKYLAKLLDPVAWKRVVTLQTDFRLLWRSFVGRRHAARPGVAVAGDNGNQAFPPALFDMLDRHRPVLLAFSGSDRLYWEYKEKFADQQAPLLASFGDRLQVSVIERANHILTFAEWQERFMGLCEGWLQRHFPKARA